MDAHETDLGKAWRFIVQGGTLVKRFRLDRRCDVHGVRPGYLPASFNFCPAFFRALPAF